MTNKTITMAREREEFESLVQRKSERFQPYFIRFSDHPEADYKDGTLQWAWELWQARAALADPVPPAETWQPIHDDDLTKAENFLSTRLKDAMFFPAHAHELANISIHCIREVRATRSELTKARELLTEWLTSNFTGSCPERNDLRCRTDYALSNQSAPADKGQGEPVAKITLAQILKAYDYAESHPHKYLRGTTNWCAAVAHSLNAEQPAPVAVVMPERMEIPSEHAPAYVYRKGWNACLDEVAHLNPSQQETTSFDQGAALETLARQIYDSWESQPGFVPWSNVGNSLKQDEARHIARRTFELAMANQGKE